MLTALFLFLLGLLVGSFLNVIAIRWNSGISPLKGRSFCVVCRKDLPWWELIPVVSFLGLGGKCSVCKTSISWQYPLIELWTGLLFVSLFWVLGPTTYYLLFTTIFCIFVVITIYDLRHKIIPDNLVIVALILSVIFRLLNGGNWLDYLAGPILFAFFGLIWLISKGRAMGLGDAKLALSIGILLGGAEGFSAFVLAFWIGTLWTLGYMVLSSMFSSLFKGRKGLTMKSEIPFGPFLIIGAWLALVYHLDLFHVLAFLN